MNVTFACPRCQQSGRVEFEATDPGFVCPNCQQELVIPAGALVDGQLRRCLVCPSTDLFVRKDFPQRLGVGIVVVGFAISCFTWANYWLIATFVVLFATAFLDLLLYVTVGDALSCYRCSAIYRGCLGHERHGSFNLETHERYRQQAARLAERGGVPQSPTTPR
jgi:hypothetical protein